MTHFYADADGKYINISHIHTLEVVHEPGIYRPKQPYRVAANYMGMISNMYYTDTNEDAVINMQHLISYWNTL